MCNKRILLCFDESSETSGANRVLRGGSWNNWARNCRSAYRNANAPGLAWLDDGLRLSAGQDEPGPAAAGG
jgi:formylglycine-generating enzyme required for sulfatase activity